MPTLHPQASFEPISPELDLHVLVDSASNFEWVLRISAAQIRNIGPHEFERLVRIHVVLGGKPLVIQGWNDRLPRSLFSAEWLERNYDKKQESVRDLGNQTDIPMTTGHYLRSMKQLTNQWTATNYTDERRQRLYLKDIDCPPEWHDHLQKVIPPNLFYFNENVDKKGRGQDEDMFMDRNTAASAGDLMSSLPQEMRAQNLMCYIGHEGTYTPAHREMCASLGQNIMVETSRDENGEKAGSSIWFMTESKDREVVREYFLSMLGHDIEIEKHFAQINAWKKAHFPIYVVEQKVGDFILVPPLAPHQVWNRGTRTMKVAWNRTTVETLELAISEALPKARLVCRDEQYKNKAIIYYTLQKYYREMVDMEETAEMGWLGIGHDLIRNSVRMKQMAQDFKKLFALFTTILVDEMFSSKEKAVELIEFDSNITCSYCRSNIFNRFLTCKHCVRDLVNDEQDTYDVCMECYAMGRSCVCISGLSWCEQWKWSELVDNYEVWRTMIIKNDGYVDIEKSPMPLEVARKQSSKKSVAQICQEQLRRRPFKDITKQEEPSDVEPLSEPEVDEEGRVVRKKRKNTRKKKKGDIYRCHVCCHKDYTYKLAFCSNPSCTDAYCFGVLYRAFDSMPQIVMQDENWKCPKCRKICNCGACRRTGNTNPYTPKNTLLGHDTRTVADDRSVETLVDFRLHNLSWLKAAGDDARNMHSKRMQKLKEVANAEKSKQKSLSDAILLPDTSGLDAAIQQSVAQGYSDHSDVLGADVPAPIYDATPDRQPRSDAEHDGAEVVADMSHGPEDTSSYPDLPTYPDPSMLGHERMIGMGYYEQDESEDRILFDPYQAPSAETWATDEQPSEFVKKAIRAAKRKARQENDDDPDFAAPRNHYKKKQKVDNEPADPFDNMDPALFNNKDTSMLDVPAEVDFPTDPIPQPEEPKEAVPEVSSKDREGEELQLFSENRPALRHARPRVSYIELDDGVEFNDTIPVKELEKPTEPSSGNCTADPLDLAANAVHALPGAAPAMQANGANLVEPMVPRKRGRPPGRPRKSEPIPSRVWAPAVEEPRPSTPQGYTMRGRPTRSSAAHAECSTNAEANELVKDSVEVRGDNTDDEVVKELEQQLARELAGLDDEDEPVNASGLARKELEKPAARRRPGHPPKQRPTEASIPSSASILRVEIPSLPNSTAFLSMSERMALQGKKFKIRKKKPDEKFMTAPKPKPIIPLATNGASQSSHVPTKEPGPHRKSKPSLDDDAFIPANDHDSSAHSNQPPIQARRPRRAARKAPGPTVVRLTDSEDEEEPALDSNDSSESYLGDSDIPNWTGRNVARRGRSMTYRGQGQGRGRGRGRGRGH